MKAVVKATTTHKGIAITKVKELKKLYSEMQSLFLAALDKGVRMGEILSDIKADLPHGQFGAWVNNAGLPFTYRTANLYMRLYTHREAISAANIGGIEEAQKFLSSGGNIDPSNSQELANLKNANPSNEAAFEVNNEELNTIKLTAREKQLIAAIVEAGGDKYSAEVGIKAEKFRAKQEREKRKQEREKKKEAATSPTHFKNLEVPPNLYRRFARVAKLTGRPMTDILQEAADALAKQQKKK